MKVYVLNWNYSENGYNRASGMEAIYLSEEKAKSVMDELNNNEAIRYEGYHFTYEEWEIV